MLKAVIENKLFFFVIKIIPCLIPIFEPKKLEERLMMETRIPRTHCLRTPFWNCSENLYLELKIIKDYWSSFDVKYLVANRKTLSNRIEALTWKLLSLSLCFI